MFEISNLKFIKILKLEQNNNNDNSNNIKWNQKCLIWVFWPINLKTIVIFEINILKFAEMQKIIQNKKKSKFGTKNTLFGHFGQ